jgi:hypothetical protein
MEFIREVLAIRHFWIDVFCQALLSTFYILIQKLIYFLAVSGAALLTAYMKEGREELKKHAEKIVFYGIIPNLIVWVPVFIFQFAKAPYTIKHNLTAEVGSYETNKKILEAKIKDGQMAPGVKAIKDREGLSIEGTIRYEREYETPEWSVTNSGDVDLVLDKAKMYCGNDLIAWDDDLQWSKEKDRVKNQSGYVEIISDTGRYRLASGDIVKNIGDWRNNDFRGLPRDFAWCKKGLWIQVITTRGNRFKGTIKQPGLIKSKH